jgi:vacuolar-type H+-ATPase subunit F/Vma7
VAHVQYIGDEATAAAFRLAGADCRVPGPGEAPEVFRRAIADGADVILLAAEHAAALDPAELSAALTAEEPLVAIVPDVFGRHVAPDVAREVRLALGIES